MDLAGNPIFANNVPFVSFGPKIAPAPNTSGACLDSVIDGIFGDDALEGFPGNVLGRPDASVVFGCDPNGFSGFTSIGSGGVLEVAFPGNIADSNIVGVFDLFLFDAGGAGDNAVFKVDAVPPLIDATPDIATRPVKT